MVGRAGKSLMVALAIAGGSSFACGNDGAASEGDAAAQEGAAKGSDAQSKDRVGKSAPAGADEGPRTDGPSPAAGRSKAKRGYPDPLLIKVCMAFEAEVGHNPSPDSLLARAALRAVEEQGVSEAQLETIGARPEQALAYVESHGSPEACTGFVTALKRAAKANAKPR